MGFKPRARNVQKLGHLVMSKTHTLSRNTRFLLKAHMSPLEGVQH